MVWHSLLVYFVCQCIHWAISTSARVLLRNLFKETLCICAHVLCTGYNYINNYGWVYGLHYHEPMHMPDTTLTRYWQNACMFDSNYYYYIKYRNLKIIIKIWIIIIIGKHHWVLGNHYHYVHHWTGCWSRPVTDCSGICPIWTWVLNQLVIMMVKYFAHWLRKLTSHNLMSASIFYSL